MKHQIIKVNTKQGLIAAFHCAAMNKLEIANCCETDKDRRHRNPMTAILLKRKSGETKFLISAHVEGKHIRKALRAIREIPAEELLA